MARYTALLYSFKINIITTDCTEARRQRVSVYTHFSRVRLGEEEANVKMCESAAQQMFEISPFALRDRAPRPVVIVVGGLFLFSAISSTRHNIVPLLMTLSSANQALETLLEFTQRLEQKRGIGNRIETRRAYLDDIACLIGSA